MSANGQAPFIHVEDSNGNPIVGAVLKVYEARTTTYRAIYSDTDLEDAMANPLSGVNASDASGNFPRFFMSPGAYKLRAETSTGALIWEWDDIDTGLSAFAGALPIAAGGTGATTAAAARANLDVPANSELTDLANTVSAFSNSLQNLVSAPQGRLTPTSGVPVISTSVIGGTAVYYTPYNGKYVAVYDGSQSNLQGFDELTLTLSASHVLNSIYDVFAFMDSGTLRIGTGPAWTGIAPGSGARGSGAGTSDLLRANGLLVNANAMSAVRNGASTYSVPQFQATYLGSIWIDGTAGQITCHTSYGQNRKWSIWNAYNRAPIYLKCGDPTSSWAYTTNTLRPANGSASNKLSVFQGLAEENYDLAYSNVVTASLTNNQVGKGQIGIGFNSSSASSGKVGLASITNSSGGTLSALNMPVNAKLLTFPLLGIADIYALESGLAADSCTFNGTEGSMLLSALWRG